MLSVAKIWSKLDRVWNSQGLKFESTLGFEKDMHWYFLILPCICIETLLNRSWYPGGKLKVNCHRERQIKVLIIYADLHNLIDWFTINHLL